MFRDFYRQRIRPKGYLAHLVRERTGCSVKSGPFAGMRYIDASFGSAYIPKLLGTYEQELSNVLAGIIAKRPKAVVDVGAAEGYYAVGLARALPDAEVVAFEAEAEGRALLGAMVDLNGVADQLKVRGRCDPAALRKALQELGGTPLIVADAEGAESDLIDLEAVPELASCELLIETHDFVVPGITERLMKRLQPTHSITVIQQSPRTADDFPFSTFYTRLLPRRNLEKVVNERRPEAMRWLHCVPLLPDSSN